MVKRTLSHFSYLVFLLLGAYIAFRGAEDFGLLLFGKMADATVLQVSSHSVRVGKSGRGIQHYAKYEFTASDGQHYRGSGEIGGQTSPEKGAKMTVRYLSFSPSVNGPKDDVLGTGVILTLVGAFLTFVVFAAWRRKMTIDRARE